MWLSGGISSAERSVFLASLSAEERNALLSALSPQERAKVSTSLEMVDNAAFLASLRYAQLSKRPIMQAKEIYWQPSGLRSGLGKEKGFSLLKREKQFTLPSAPRTAWRTWHMKRRLLISRPSGPEKFITSSSIENYTEFFSISSCIENYLSSSIENHNIIIASQEKSFSWGYLSQVP